MNEGKPYWFSALEGSYMHVFGAARVAMAMQDNTKLVAVPFFRGTWVKHPGERKDTRVMRQR